VGRRIAGKHHDAFLPQDRDRNTNLELHMKNLKTAIVFAAATIGAATSAFAGSGTIVTNVTSLSDLVTWSRDAYKSKNLNLDPLVSYVGYNVEVSNPSGNTINNIVFQGTTTVSGSNEAAEFDSAYGATCNLIANPAGYSANARTISCTIGQLTAGNPYPKFGVFFKAPKTGTSVYFSGVTYYAEGTGGVPSSQPANSVVCWPGNVATITGDCSTTAPLVVALGTPNPTSVISGVPHSGATLYTGDQNTDSTVYTLNTKVKVPQVSTYVLATIALTDATLDCRIFTKCWNSAITIPGTFSPYLTIVLRQDASSIINNSSSINDATIKYRTEPALSQLPTDLQCASDSTGTVCVVQKCVGFGTATPTVRPDGVPCIASQQVYKKNYLPNPDLGGDWEWTLINLKNGGYKVL
jgi:hypothetical protein